MNAHTEEQAKKLWCPMARVARREDLDRDRGPTVIVGGCNTDALGGNRIPASCRCVASQCAMWRWAESYPEDRGYCGLAGQVVLP